MNDPFHDNRFLRDWILASILALIAGTVLSWYTLRAGLDFAEALKAAMRWVIPNRGLGQVLLSLPVYLATTTNVGAVVGICLSLAQWLVLRQRTAWAREWLVASLIGAVLSYVLMAALNILAILVDPDPRLLKGLEDSGVWIGVIMGLAQWRVLRKYTSHAFWWVIASVGLWSISSPLHHLWGQRIVHFVSGMILKVLRQVPGIRNIGGLRPFVAVQFGMWAVVGAVWGLVAGKVLARLLKKPEAEKVR